MKSLLQKVDFYTYTDLLCSLRHVYISFPFFKLKIGGDQHVVLSDKAIVDLSLSGWSREEGQV